MAVEVVVSVVRKIAEYLVAPIGKQFGYLFSYSRNIENMRSQVEKLKEKELGVQGDVNVAKRNTENIRAEVTGWKTRVEKEEKKANKILEGEEMVRKGCLNGWCPNIKSRYSQSRKASKITQNLDKLLAEGEFKKVAESPIPTGVVHTPPVVDMGMSSTSEGSFEGFESRSLIMRDVMKSLKDDNVHVIGIWGMGGVGKTTMAKEIVERVKKEGVFDEVVMVVVSQNPVLEKVQGHIAEFLGLKFAEQSLFARACRLHKRLTQKGENDKPKKILVILDDVWERLVLQDVGIPSANDHGSCKILLTSRQKDVCDQMRTDKTYSVEVLTTEEAWDLFQKTAGISLDATDLFLIAKDVVKECGGLPIAITTIARALGNKSRPAWNTVLKQLKRSALEGGDAVVYATFQVSYDFLTTEEIKAFFVLCCLFPEDFDIPIEDLVKYGVGLKILRNISTFHEAREKGHAYIETLRKSNLLLDSAKVDCIKVHDLVRDFTLSTASKGRFLVRFGNAMEWLDEDMYQQYTSISLQSDKMDGILDSLKCPNLELLRLAGLDYGLLEFPEIFFKGMRKLKVLVMEHVSIQSLPGSLQLTSLRALSLNHCRLRDDVSMIGGLEVLEILSFAHSEIQDLPIEIGKLNRLRLLDLTASRKLQRIAPGILLSLTRLEELYLRGTSIRWAEQMHANPVIHGDGAAHDDGGGVEKNASFLELAKLSSLIVLEIDIPDEVLPVDLSFLEKLEKLEKFYVCVGAAIEKEIKHVFQNTLCCMIDTGVLFDGIFKVLCRKTEVLDLRVKDLKNLQEEVEREDFFKLRDLSLVSCDVMVSLVNTLGRQTTKVFPKLESLCLQDMRNLEHICLSQTSNLSLSIVASSSMNELTHFGNLRCVEVKGCHKLKSIFSVSMARGLINLRRLKVVGCGAMEELFTKERGDEDKEASRKIVFLRLESLNLVGLPNLVGFCKAVDEIELPQLVTLHLERLPRITSIYSKAENLDSELQQASSNHPFFVEKVNTNNMSGLELYNMENLKEIWPAHFQYYDCISKLESISVMSCPRLLNVFPSNMIQGLQNLLHLSVWRCDSLEGILDLQELDITNNHEIEVVPPLKSIVLEGFHNLREVSVKRCSRLQSVFPSSIARGLVMLESLYVEDCEMMDAIFWKDQRGEDVAAEAGTAVAKIQFPHLKDLYFYNLPNLVHFCKSFEEVEFPQLEEVELRHLPKLDGFASKGVLFNTMQVQNLRYLDIYYCGSLEVIFYLQRSNVNEGCHELAVLTQLQSVWLWRLDNLRHVWRKGPLVIQAEECLQNLSNLIIHDCENLEAIVAEEEGIREECIVEGGGERFILFPRLTTLSLDDVPKLITITPKPTYRFNSSCLKHLTLSGDCRKLLETLKNDAILQVNLDNLETLNLLQINDLTVFFPTSLPHLSQLQNLQKLDIQSCSLLEVVFDLQGLEELIHNNNNNNDEEGHEQVLGTVLTQLTDVRLCSLRSLTHVWRKDPHALIQVGPFRNLSSLRITECGSLRHVFTPSIAKLLSGLENLEILECENLEAIVAKEGEEDYGEEEYSMVEGGGIFILFPQLTTFTLKKLPKLLTITPRPYTFKWSSLKTLSLNEFEKLPNDIGQKYRTVVHLR